MASTLPVIASGDWQHDPLLGDYRYEWLNDILVERATWAEEAPERKLGGVTIAAPGYIWFRFWMPAGDHILEKYFDQQGGAIGIYAHVGMALPQHGRSFSLVDLMLGLWISADAHVTVHNEASFDVAVQRGTISPVEAEHAEHQIREMTTAIAMRRYPPPMIRNFSIVARP